MFEAVPNFSEGRRPAVVAALADDQLVLDVHADPDHNRAVVTMAAADPAVLADALLGRIAVAVDRIDLRDHAGVHPRVGAADVVPIVPLASAAMADAVDAARALAERVWRELGVPVHLYGAAAGGRRLAAIRAGRTAPDVGTGLHPTAGAVCIGARRPLVAYNLLFPGLDRAAVAALVPAMRALPGVQALAFGLSGGRTQLSMNLTDLDATAVPAAFARACELAGRPGEPELVGLCPAAAAGPGCDGALLEARLAAAAARRAAAAAEARGAEELHRLGRRLAAESRSLGRLGAEQDVLLGGAERAAALVRVLRAAGLDAPDLDAQLSAAAAGLRAAISTETAGRYPQRVALLDGAPLPPP